MKHIYNILLLTILVTSVKCGSDTPFLEDPSVPLNEKFKVALDNYSDMEFYNQDELLTHDDILTFYENNDFNPLWINDTSITEKGEDMIDLVDNAYAYGLLPEFFNQNSIHKAIDSSRYQTEILLTNSYILYMSHLSVGFLDTTSMTYAWKKDSLPFDIQEELHKAKESENITETLTAHQPKHWEYVQLQKGLADFVANYGLDTAHFEIPKFKEDSTKCYEVAKQALIAHHFIDSTANDTVFIDRLKDYQIIHGLLDGIKSILKMMKA